MSVILNHCVDNAQEILFPLWGSPAVPLFILIQVFHFFKQTHTPRIDTLKLWKRIVKPFLVVQAILFTIWILCYDMPIYEQFKLLLYKGGKGPGSYYVWIYLQIAFLLPLFSSILNRINKCASLVLFILLSQLFESLFCFLQLADYIYVLLCARYIFLIFLGFLIVKSPFIIDTKTIAISILSLISLILFSYSKFSFWPLFYNHPHFTTCHYPCYYYIYALLIFILIRVHHYLFFKVKILSQFICRLGKDSYTIFLSQMAFFSIMDIYPIKSWFISVVNKEFGDIIYIVFSIVVCLCPVFFPKLKEKL